MPSAIVVIGGALTLFEDWTDVDLGIDRLIASEPAPRRGGPRGAFARGYVVPQGTT